MVPTIKATLIAVTTTSRRVASDKKEQSLFKILLFNKIGCS